MKTDDFSYYLPQELIAQVPIEVRDQSRLMLVDRSDGSIKHSLLSNLGDYLKNGDVLVFNDSRVIAARLKGSKVGTGGRVEVLVLRHNSSGEWEALIRPGKRISIGGRIEITGDPVSGSHKSVIAEVTAVKDDGIKLVRFSDEEELSALGSMPLPPYIKTPLSEPERYQTVYAAEPGSAAAPTAGLHFTHKLIASLRKKGVECLFTTLHIGLDTFRPVKEEDPQKHPIHREYAVIGEETAHRLNLTKKEARRIICVGTTTVRLLEYAARIQGGEIKPFRGWVDLFILPGHQFSIVDGMLTNFHLPRSTLLMMVAAFSGQELIKKAYKQATKAKYRFYSFGDCMLVI